MTFSASSFSTASFSQNAFLFNGIVPPVPLSGSSQGVPVGWGSGRKHGVSGQRHDDIKIERKRISAPNKSGHLSKLRIQEIDNHDIMLFVKTFRQYRK